MNQYRAIRSFVKRHRTLTPKKQAVYQGLWQIYGLTIENLAKHLAPANAPFHALEIGFGDGTNLYQLAQQFPTRSFVGIEVHEPGVLALLTKLQHQPLDNLKILKEDAVVVLANGVPNHSLDLIMILFPDPWPKKRHHKRRLLQDAFITTIQNKLKPGGLLQIATDWSNYAEAITSLLDHNAAFTKAAPEVVAQLKSHRAPTKYEQRGHAKGHQVFDLIYSYQPIE